MSAPDRSEFDRLFALRMRQLAVAVAAVVVIVALVVVGCTA